MSARSRVTAFGAAVLAFAAAGCVSILPDAGPPPEIYRLDPPVVTSQTRGEINGGTLILVPRPSATPALATDRVVVSEGGETVAYAAGARWAAETPELIQARLMRALEDEGFTPVRPGEGVRAPFVLRVEIEAFEAAYPDGGGAPDAHVRLRASVVDQRERALLGRQHFDAAQPAARDAMTAIVAAMRVSADTASGDLAGWAREKVDAAG